MLTRVLLIWYRYPILAPVCCLQLHAAINNGSMASYTHVPPECRPASINSAVLSAPASGVNSSNLEASSPAVGHISGTNNAGIEAGSNETKASVSIKAAQSDTAAAASGSAGPSSTNGAASSVVGAASSHSRAEGDGPGGAPRVKGFWARTSTVVVAGILLVSVVISMFVLWRRVMGRSL